MSLAKRNSEAAKEWASKRRELQKRRALKDAKSIDISESSDGMKPVDKRSNPRIDIRVQEPHPTIPTTPAKMTERFMASKSHELNAQYMEEFGAGFASGYLELDGQGKVQGGAEQITSYNPGRAKKGPASSGKGGSMRGGCRHLYQCVRKDYFGATTVHSQLGPERKKDASLGVSAAMEWYQGPTNHEGQLVDLSDRNLLCASVRGDEAVFGCADHALYCVDLSRGVKTRRLYGSSWNSRAGHTEWVTSVTHTAHGDIVSGGMDGKLCIWPESSEKLRGIKAHERSISVVKTGMAGGLVSCDYGGVLRIWDCRRVMGGSSCALRLSGEMSDSRLTSPCLDFTWDDVHMLAGYRDGCLGLYDIEAGALVVREEGAHRGHVTTVNKLPGNSNSGGGHPSCFLTGGQDGYVRIWDARVAASGTGHSSQSSGLQGLGLVMEAPAHRGRHGVGAVGGVIPAGATGNRLVSFGADKRISILDTRHGRGTGREPSSFGARGSDHVEGLGSTAARSRSRATALGIEKIFDDHKDSIYCMDFVPGEGPEDSAGILVTGGGDGMLLVHDLGSMKLLYGLGCSSAGAVRCAIAQGRRLTVGADDGNMLVFQFGSGAMRRDQSAGESWKWR